MILPRIIEFTYGILPAIYGLQLYFFNGNHFKILKRKLVHLPSNRILEFGCGTAPILTEFHPKLYVGIDIENKFIEMAKKKNKKLNYNFYVNDVVNFNTKQTFDIVIFSHTTHHIPDIKMKKIISTLKRIDFKFLVVYDGKPTGLFAPILTRLDLGSTFRELKELSSIFKKDFKIIHSETFMSNRPFYKYPLLIMKKK